MTRTSRGRWLGAEGGEIPEEVIFEDAGSVTPVYTRPATVSGGSRPSTAERTAAAGGGGRVAEPEQPKPTPKAGADTTHYRRFGYECDRKINDRVAFMPLMLGAFEQASNGPVDCYLTTAISNYRLPEVNYVEARWNRRTWRETNRVRNSLSRLHVEPYDAMYELDGNGKKVLGPFKRVLEAITAIETALTKNLTLNKNSIADSASNLRWMVVDIIRQQIRLMDRDVRVDAKHQLKKMIKSVFTMRYKNYDRLPFATYSHQNNEVWNGTDYANGFHKAGFLSKIDATTKAEYLLITSTQEKLNIDIAVTSMKHIGEIYTSLIDSLDIVSGVNDSSLLDEVDLAFKRYSLGKAGLTGVPESASLSTGALMLDLQKATGTFMWELLLERLEILRSNVFSYFSIITHDNDNSESKLNGSGAKSNGFHSAAQLTDAYMDKAVPACLSHLFEKLSPGLDIDTMRIDQSRLHDYAAIVGYYNAMRVEFTALSNMFIGDIRVSLFSEFQSPTDGATIGKNPATYYSVRGEVRRAIVDEFVSMYFKNSPNLSCLKIPQTFGNISEQWARTMGQMDATRIDRSNVSGTPDDHPLRNYPNKARDAISKTVMKRMGTTDATDTVFGAVCKIVYANYHADGAFSSLLVNKQESYHQMNKARFVRRYYRSVSNPIAISSSFIADYDAGAFDEEKVENEALMASNVTRKITNDEFTLSYAEFIRTHPLLASPAWISTPLISYADFTTDAVGTFAKLFKIKRGALGSLTRKPESKHAHASHQAPKAATNQKKQPAQPSGQRQLLPPPGTS